MHQRKISVLLLSYGTMPPRRKLPPLQTQSSSTCAVPSSSQNRHAKPSQRSCNVYHPHADIAQRRFAQATLVSRQTDRASSFKVASTTLYQCAVIAANATLKNFLCLLIGHSLAPPSRHAAPRKNERDPPGCSIKSSRPPQRWTAAVSFQARASRKILATHKPCCNAKWTRSFARKRLDPRKACPCVRAGAVVPVNPRHSSGPNPHDAGKKGWSRIVLRRDLVPRGVAFQRDLLRRIQVASCGLWLELVDRLSGARRSCLGRTVVVQDVAGGSSVAGVVARSFGVPVLLQLREREGRFGLGAARGGGDSLGVCRTSSR